MRGIKKVIITKTPFRVSFCGGGSDMPSFYRENGGCVLSTTINRYMYITVHPYFDPDITALRYSKIEIVDDLKKIEHRILHSVLNDMQISGVEISSTADVPSGTGLGSSSSFTVGLLHTLYCYQEKFVSKAQLAENACEIEIVRTGAPIGKQDQYAAAFGGLNLISFHPDDTVSVEPVVTKGSTLKQLQDNLMFFYTGYTHDANEILTEQNENIIKAEQRGKKIQNLLDMCGLARSMKHSLEENNLDDFGKMLNEGWNKKRELASGVSRPEIDDLYECALRHGASGGKLLGAGGGGFLMFFCPPERQRELREALKLPYHDFKFEHDGSSIVYIGDKYW